MGSVTDNFFATLGVRPAAGRAFAPQEGVPGGPRAVMLSFALAQRQFGGAAAAVGQAVQLNGASYQVVGVMPSGFGFPERSDLWIPLTVPMTFESFAPFRGYIPSRALARLADGVSLEAAAARMGDVWRALPDEMRADYADEALNPLDPLQRDLVGGRRTALLVLLGATGLLLLIACGNVTSLLLARGALRRREMAVRAALGASRGRLVRQLVLESLLLSLAGTAAGLLVAAAGLGVVRALLPQGLSAMAPVALDLRVLAFATLLAVVTGLVFGLWPAFGAARADAAETMKSGGAASTRHGARRLRAVLIVGELAVALTLLIGAGLMLKSFHALVTLDPGFRPDRVATLELAMSRAPMSRRLALLDGIVQRLSAMPGIEAAGVINDLPLGPVRGISLNLRPEGRPPEWNANGPYARMLFASPGFFRALDISLLRGRLMQPSDDSLAPHVVVINATMAQQYWPGEDALGKRMNDFGAPGAPEQYRTVVGIVADVREASLEREPTPQMYFPIYESPPVAAALVVRGVLPAQQLFTAMRAVVRELDPNQPVYNVRTMDDVRSASVAVRRTNTMLITAFGAVALLLAMVGVYGVVAYSVAQRGREMGIRAALGATRADLVRLVMTEGGAMALAGVALGLAGAWAFARALRSLLFGVGPLDPMTFAGAAALLALLALAATVTPARRAARSNPVEVIRAE